MPLGYMSVKRSGWPAVMPAPHSPAAVPGRAQVVVPLGTTFQPCAASRIRAAGTLNGYGFTDALAFAYGFAGLGRDRAVGGHAEAVVVGVDPAGLVDEVLERLAEVQLPEDRPDLRVVEVRLEVVEAEREVPTSR